MYRNRADDDFILGEALLKVVPVCLPPWAVEGIRHDFEDDNIVMYRSALGEAAAFRGSPGESGDAAEPARQLFPDNHVFLRIEGLSFIVRHGRQDFNEMHGSPPARFVAMLVNSNAIVFREEHLPNGGGWKARPGLDRRRHLNEATCRLPQTRKQERFEWHKRIRETSSCAAASVRLLAKCKPASRARCGERVTRAVSIMRWPAKFHGVG